jgi:hypothetical protein
MMTRVLVTNAVSELRVPPARVRVADYTNLPPMFEPLDGLVSDTKSHVRTLSTTNAAQQKAV